MKTLTKEAIKNNIREAVMSNPTMEIDLETGYIGSLLSYSSKKDFGNKILSLLKDDEVSDVVFKGIVDNKLRFKMRYRTKDNFCNDRGYGSGRYMGD